jgi:uncharacterized membrane protein
MSDLVVRVFDGVGTADEVLTKLRGMRKENLIDLGDACRGPYREAGKVQVKHAVNLMSLGASRGLSSGMLIGALAGLLVLNPLAGIAGRYRGWRKGCSNFIRHVGNLCFYPALSFIL